MRFPHPFRPALVGLDIGSDAVKGVVLRRNRAGWALVGAAEVPLPDTGSSDPDVAVTAVREVLDTLRLRRSRVAAALAGQAVMVKRLSLPVMSDAELAEALPWEAEQYVPFDLAEVQLDFERLDAGAVRGTTEVLLIAAKKDRIGARTDLVLRAGARPVVLDVEACALVNAYLASLDAPPNDRTLLMHAGRASTIVCLLEGGELVFTRDLALGGVSYTDALVRDLGVEPTVAERLKQPGRPLVPGVDADQVLAVLLEVTTQIVAEARKSLDFFRAASPSEPIQRVVLSGGACRAEGLQAVLAHEFDAPVEVFDPFRRIVRAGRRPPMADATGPSFAVAVGLAMRQDGAA